MSKGNLKKYFLIGIPALLIVALIVVSAVFFIPWQSKEQKRIKRVQSGEEPLNVILISIDTTRADRIGCYGCDDIDTPNIDYLAEGGVRFAECKAQVPLTLPSHTTMLTGSFPPFTGVRTNDYHVPEKAVTLAETLGEEGYDSAAFISSAILYASTGINQGFDFFDDETRPPITWQDLKPHQRRAGFTWESARNWLKERDDEDPFFMFIHYYDPHTGYYPPAPFSIRYEENPYMGEIAYVDYIIGDLIPTLKKEGYYDNTMIIVTSDHGECLGEHGEKEHGVFVYEAAVHVPLIFYCPGLIPAGKVVEEPVVLADIAPTIYDILGVEFPDVVQGESLIPQMFGKKKPHREIYEESLYMNRSFGWGSIYALEHDGYKYIECPKPELYNLREDPAESENLIEIEAELATEMSGKLGELLAAYAAGEIEADGKKSAAELDELAGLGYFGAAPEDSFEETPTGEIPDCKDNTDFINTFTLGQSYEIQQEYEKAVDLYKQALEIVPDSTFLNYQISRVYRDIKEMDKAVEYAERAVELAPNNVSTRVNLANIYLNQRRFKEAREILEPLKDEDMSDAAKSSVYVNLSLVSYYGYDNIPKATEEREIALELTPNNRKLYYDLVFLYAAGKRYDEAEEAANKYIEIVRFGPNVEVMKIALLKIEQLRKENP